MDNKTIYFYGGNHPIHESLIRYPPNGFTIISNIQNENLEIEKTYDSFSQSRRNISNIFISTFNIPRIMLFHFKTDIDLIHTANGIIPITRKPWIVSIEYFSSFFGLNHTLAMTKRSSRIIKRFLSQDRCKQVLCFSEATKKSVINAYNPSEGDYLSKLNVLYPAIKPPPAIKKEVNEDEIKILFIGGTFFEKGGRELVHAINMIRKGSKKRIKLIAFAKAPIHSQDLFNSFIGKERQNKDNIFFTNWISRTTLFKEYYTKCDIFAFPSFGDLAGYSILEAMSARLPIIAQNIFAVPEFVENGKNGFLLKNPISPYLPNYLRKNTKDEQEYINKVALGQFPELENDLADKLRILIEDNTIRKEFGNNSYELVANGKFSISERNKRLSNIYKKALD